MIRLIQDKPTNSDYIFYAVVSTITAYTHYFGAILIGLQFVYLLAIAIRYNRNQLKRIIPVELLLVIAYLPWVSVLLFVGRVISSGTFWIPPVQLAYFGEYLKFIFYPDQIILLVSIVLLFILPFLLDEKQFTKRFMAFIRSVKVTSPSFILGYLILGTIIPTYIISVVWHPMLIPRYVLHLAPFIYILGAVWISNCSRLLDWKQTAYTFVVCMICLTLFLPSYYLPHKEQWREASAFAVNESNNKTMMVTLGNAEQDTYRYYLNQSHIPTDLFVYQKRDEENITGATDKMYKLNKNRLVILDTHYTDLSTNDYTLLNSACKTHSKTDFVGINVSVYQF